LAIQKNEKRLNKLKTEREKFDLQLKELLDKIKGNDNLTEETENTLIVELVRDMQISPETLKEILNAKKSEEFIGTRDIPQIIPEADITAKSPAKPNIFERNDVEYEEE